MNPRVLHIGASNLYDPRSTVATPSETFLDDLAKVLKENHCEGLVGLDTLHKHDWAEVSIGDASVIVHSNKAGENSDFVNVSFAFRANNAKAGVHGRCGKGQNKHTSKPPSQ